MYIFILCRKLHLVLKLSTLWMSIYSLRIFSFKRNMLPWAHHEWSPICFSRPQVYCISQFYHIINFKLRSRDQIFLYADPVENSLYTLSPLKMVLPFLWWRNMEFLKIIRFTQRVLYHYLKFLLVPRILCKLVVTTQNHEEFEVKWMLIDNQR